MARQGQPEFSGGVNDDLATLAELFRSEVQIAAGRSEPFFDGFSVGVSDGISMLVTLPWIPRSGQDGIAVGEFTLDGLAVAQELLEVKYWSLDAAGIGNFPPQKLAELDRELVALYDQACSPSGAGSVDVGVHLRFEGDDAAVPEERLPPGAIHERRHAARATAPVDANRPGSAVGEGALGPMAVDAGQRAVAREPSFLKQAAAERDPGRHGRIVSGLGPVEIQPERTTGFDADCPRR